MQRFFLFLLFALLSHTLRAVSDEKVLLTGNVFDSYSRVCLTDVWVEVLSAADSSVVAADSCRDWTLQNPASIRKVLLQELHPSDYMQYRIRVPAGSYVLRFTREGYTPLTMPLSIPERKYRQPVKEWKAQQAFMQRQMQYELGEAVVKATKIMMVNRGDTVVFNADYFQLAHGNMLDKLVAMLPGLEIKSGGMIFYNGQPLNNLLVNGKDFFKGDAAMALQNLPAYMVKELKVYHKEKDTDYLRVHKDSEETGKPNTLDVVLKKAYSHGWITNCELAGGPATGTDAWKNMKYLARLFVLHYGEHSRLGVVGNANNISDMQTADGNGNWQPSGPAANGVTEMACAGLDYGRESQTNGLRYDMNMKASRKKTDTEQYTARTAFLDGGDAFSRTALKSGNEAAALELHNELSWHQRRFILFTPLDIELSQTHNHGSLLAAQFDRRPHEDYRGACLDSLFAGPQSLALAEMLANSQELYTREKSRSLKLNYRLNLAFRTPLTGNKLEMEGSVRHSRQEGEKFEHNRMEFPQTAATDFRNRYFETPDRSTFWHANAEYDFGNCMPEHLARTLQTRLFYEYDGRNCSGDRRLYNLHLLEGMGEETPLGMLPSVEGWRKECFDVANSYHQDERKDLHKVSANFVVKFGKYGSVNFVPKAEVYHTRYTDSRSNRQADRKRAYFTSYIRYYLSRKQLTIDSIGKSHTIEGTYHLRRSQPESRYLLDIMDDTNPLALTLGNAFLHDPSTHDFDVYYTYRKERWASVEVSANFMLTDNAIAMGYSYDARTGVYTYRPENVDGNWQTSLHVNYQQPFGKGKRFNLSSSTAWTCRHSVDIVNSRISTVRNHGVEEKAGLHCNIGSLGRISLKATALWQRADSRREDYRRRNTWDLQYGPDLSLHLPHDLSFSTDFGICQRRGYDDRSMNDTECLWNATLNWDFDFRRSSYHRYVMDEGFTEKVAGTGKRPWTVSLKAHDLLRQLSNTRRVLNAQGITEMWYNVVPSYVMLSLSYRFAKQPKKK